MRILVWHVHGSWLTAFVQGGHDYLLPVTDDRGSDGLGRARTWDWPTNAVELTPGQLRAAEIDAVVLQRPHELELVEQWTGRRPGRDLPAVFLEHNAPDGDVPLTRHCMAERADIPLVHVTHFNALLYDNGRAPVRVIEHGIVDPGPLWTGELARTAVVVNDPVRRGRYVGTDLLPGFAAAAPLDVFGMRVSGLPERLGLADDRLTVHEDLAQAAMHRELARRRCYLHPVRWTSLGLSLLEAMHLGMPVAALATTEVTDAVPPHAGVVSARPEVLAGAIREWHADLEAAAVAGKAAREAALERYGLSRFLADWDRLLVEVTR
jgi:glycosyltransferase involved in cell wall biosynthesis